MLSYLSSNYAKQNLEIQMRGCCWISLHLLITSDQHFYHHLTFVFEKKWMHIALCTAPAATTFPAPVHKPPPQRRATNKLAASHPTTSAGTSLHTTRSAPGRRRTTRVCTWSAYWSDERSNSNPQKHISMEKICKICVYIPESSPSGQRGEVLCSFTNLRVWWRCTSEVGVGIQLPSINIRFWISSQSCSTCLLLEKMHKLSRVFILNISKV